MEKIKAIFNKEGKVILGVCSGIAPMLKIDVKILRIVFSIAALFWGIGIGIYLIIHYAIMPKIALKKTDQERIELKNNSLKELAKLENFSPTKKFTGAWGDLIAIDEKRKQIALKQAEQKIKIHPYSSIINVEVGEAAHTEHSSYTTSSSRTAGVVGRSIVGGLVGRAIGGSTEGAAGAIIGGLSGKRDEYTEHIEDTVIRSAGLNILLNDVNTPNIMILFFDSWEETLQTEEIIRLSDPVYGPIYEESLDKLLEWESTLKVIINQNTTTEVKTPQAPSSIANELSKLNELKEKGILTEEEFQQQKKKLL